MAVTIEDIKKLKELTGIGLTDAKKALVEAEGDFDKALEALRKKGLTKAEKKGDRETREFKEFAHQIAMQIAAMAPKYATMDDIPSDVYEAKKTELLESESLKSKPEAMREQIVDGQLKKYFAEQVLAEQAFVLDDSKTVGELIKEQIVLRGENVRVSQFKRIELGVTE